jgi:hypothetical protein
MERALPDRRSEEDRSPTSEQLRQQAEKQIQDFAHTLGLGATERDNLVFSGANAAMANGGVVNQANLMNETAKITGIPPEVLKMAQEAVRGAQVSGVALANFNSVSVPTLGGAQQQRGSGITI